MTLPGSESLAPDFLGLGAQRAGSSWLHHHLQPQPGLWLPPIKELQYLNARYETLGERLRGRRVSHRKARKLALRCLRRPRAPHALPTLVWIVRYMAFPRTLERYPSLFPTEPGVLRGEITPDYAMLDEATISRLTADRPRLRILYVLRDPVERAWSHLRMLAGKRGRPEFLTDPDAIVRAFEEDDVVTHGDYASHLRRWGRHVEPDRIHVAFHERRSADPAGFLATIAHFLGIHDPTIPADVAVPRNARPATTLPSTIHGLLAEAQMPSLEALDTLLATPETASWLRSAKRAACRTTPPGRHTESEPAAARP